MLTNPPLPFFLNRHFALYLQAFYQVGAGGGTRPFIPAFANQICLISLAIQAYSASPNHTVSDSFGVRFGVRFCQVPTHFLTGMFKLANLTRKNQLPAVCKMTSRLTSASLSPCNITWLKLTLAVRFVVAQGCGLVITKLNVVSPLGTRLA